MMASRWEKKKCPKCGTSMYFLPANKVTNPTIPNHDLWVCNNIECRYYVEA